MLTYSTSQQISILSSTLSVSLPAQRSAQELPQVEKSSLTSCLVSGGEEMVITGANFFPESKVIFLEKGPGKFCLRSSLALNHRCGINVCKNISSFSEATMS